VRYEVNLYILFKGNSVFKGLIIKQLYNLVILLLQMVSSIR
jgi:hypothetical protein